MKLPPAAWWLWYSSVPGMAVPGMACPGMAGTAFYPLWLYTGQVPLLYWDYVDTTTQEILNPCPGMWYTMAVVSSRAGLAVPPPDTGWPSSPADRWAPEVVLVHYAVALAEARAHTAARLAALAAQPAAPQPQGSPQDAIVAERPPPSEYALALAAARAHNAARQARGDEVGT